MQRIESAVKALRLIIEHSETSFTYDRILQALEVLDFGYTVVEDENGGKHLTLDFDEDLILHFTYENNHYEVPRYNVSHGILNELTKYYNEMNVTEYIDKSELDICFHDLEMLETVGIENWANKQVAIRQVLKKFHDDDLVATLMFLKYIGGKANSGISYVENHFTPIEYRGIKTEMCIELYNMNYYRMVTIDVENCNVVDDPFEMIVNAFRRWYK